MISKLISSTKIVHGQMPESDKADVFASRLYLALAAVLYPLLWQTLLYFDPKTTEPRFDRSIIVGITLLLLVASFLSRRVMRYLQNFILGLAWIVTAHHFYIISLNNIIPSLTLGGLVITAAAMTIFNTRRSVVLYSLYVIGLSILLLFKASPESRGQAELFLWGVATLLLVQGVATFTRISMIEALKTVETKQFSQRWLKNDYISKMASLGRMSSGVGHEINNPLAIIQGLSGQIKDIAATGEGPKKEHLIKSMEIIEKNSQRIGRVVNSLRSFSKDSFQNIYLKTPIKDIIDDAVGLSQARIGRSNVDLTVSEFSKDLIIECQRTQISHVLLCLVINALDAVEKTESPWIKIEIREFAAQVEISVTDSGKGLNKEAMQKLFEAFYTTKEKGKAMGLSLNISRRLVEDHHGHLEIDTKCANTRFVVTLPIKQAEQRTTQAAAA